MPDRVWVQRTLPRLRLMPYVIYVYSGLCFAVFQPPSLRATSEAVQAAFHIVLIASASAALIGVLAKKERVERSGLLAMLGPLVTYAVLLSLTAFKTPSPGKYATMGLSGTFLAGASFVFIAMLDVHREIKRAELVEREERRFDPEVD